MQLIFRLPLPLFLPAVLWCVRTLQVSIFLPNTTVHQLLLEGTQPPENLLEGTPTTRKPPPTPPSLTSSSNVGGQTQASQQMKSRASPTFGFPPCTGKAAWRTQQPCIGFSQPAACYLCHPSALSKYPPRSPAPRCLSSLAQSKCHALRMIAGEAKALSERRRRKRWGRRAIFLSNTFPPRYLPFYQEPMDHRIRPASLSLICKRCLKSNTSI